MQIGEDDRVHVQPYDPIAIGQYLRQEKRSVGRARQMRRPHLPALEQRRLDANDPQGGAGSSRDGLQQQFIVRRKSHCEDNHLDPGRMLLKRPQHCDQWHKDAPIGRCGDDGPLRCSAVHR